MADPIRRASITPRPSGRRRARPPGPTRAHPSSPEADGPHQGWPDAVPDVDIEPEGAADGPRRSRLEAALARLDHADRTARVLLPSERELWRTRQHWVVLVKPLLRVAGAVAVAGVLAGSGSGVDRLVSLLVLVALVHLMVRVLSWWDVEYVLSDRRILMLTGVPRRKVASMGLRKITDMSYEQTIPGRIAGYGTLHVESAGQDQALSRVPFLPRSDAFYQVIAAQLYKSQVIQEY